MLIEDIINGNDEGSDEVRWWMVMRLDVDDMRVARNIMFTRIMVSFDGDLDADDDSSKDDVETLKVALNNKKNVNVIVKGAFNFCNLHKLEAIKIADVLHRKQLKGA
ncbi:hypothetical protein HELRODRAFT_164296 [Helobdella robusta]|uniref:Uncharacterized protein n=1 Tax=Helobdella robusta TaxID=6412 RepID=T1EV83_HELRO|nr:hypothetical protein HELRODRAFT_164296 [Helobdella robusta]ESN94451.1 hypothetical protein HELRODRAFT_164296 [Helobdella robusta]